MGRPLISEKDSIIADDCSTLFFDDRVKIAFDISAIDPEKEPHLYDRLTRLIEEFEHNRTVIGSACLAYYD